MAWCFQGRDHRARSIQRGPRVLLIEQPHHEQMFLAFSSQLVRGTGTREAKQLALLGDTQIWVVWLNQRPFHFNTVVLMFFPASLPARCVDLCARFRDHCFRVLELCAHRCS